MRSSWGWQGAGTRPAVESCSPLAQAGFVFRRKREHAKCWKEADEDDALRRTVRGGSPGWQCHREHRTLRFTTSGARRVTSSACSGDRRPRCSRCSSATSPLSPHSPVKNTILDRFFPALRSFRFPEEIKTCLCKGAALADRRSAPRPLRPPPGHRCSLNHRHVGDRYMKTGTARLPVTTSWMRP